MNGLIDRLAENDPEWRVLALTSECETLEELERFLSVLEENTCIESVVFRESFFPLRRIREHLRREDFVRMIDGVARKISQDAVIPPTMLGMLRGTLVARVLGQQCRRFYADEAITFGSPGDVEAMAEKLEACVRLHTLQLGDSYLVRTRPPSLDPLLHACASGSSHSTLVHLELSGHPEQRIKKPILGGEAIKDLLVHCKSLRLLNLSRLGLQDDAFEAIGACLHHGSLSSSKKEEEGESGLPPALQQLCLDGNRPTKAGLMSLVRLSSQQGSCGNCYLTSLSLQETRHTERIPWDKLFPLNCHLEELEVDAEHTRGDDLTGMMTMIPGFGSGGGRNAASTERAGFWMDLNAKGRKHWVSDGPDLPSALWPLVLDPLKNQPSALWYLLQTFPDALLPV